MRVLEVSDAAALICGAGWRCDLSVGCCAVVMRVSCETMVNDLFQRLVNRLVEYSHSFVGLLSYRSDLSDE